jgi:hypothetical protein
MIVGGLVLLGVLRIGFPDAYSYVAGDAGGWIAAGFAFVLAILGVIMVSEMHRDLPGELLENAMRPGPAAKRKR